MSSNVRLYITVHLSELLGQIQQFPELPTEALANSYERISNSFIANIEEDLAANCQSTPLTGEFCN